MLVRGPAAGFRDSGRVVRSTRSGHNQGAGSKQLAAATVCIWGFAGGAVGLFSANYAESPKRISEWTSAGRKHMPGAVVCQWPVVKPSYEAAPSRWDRRQIGKHIAVPRTRYRHALTCPQLRRVVISRGDNRSLAAPDASMSFLFRQNSRSSASVWWAAARRLWRW